MTLTGLLDAALADPALTRARDLARSGGVDVPVDLTGPAPLRPFVVAALAADPDTGAGRPVLAVPATSREAADLVAALARLRPPDARAVFPAWETLPRRRPGPAPTTA